VNVDPWGRPKPKPKAERNYAGTGRAGSNGFRTSDGLSPMASGRGGRFQRGGAASSSGSEWRTSRVVVNEKSLWSPKAEDQTHWQTTALPPPPYPMKPKAVAPPRYPVESRVAPPPRYPVESRVAPPPRYPIESEVAPPPPYPVRKEVPIWPSPYSAGNEAASSWPSRENAVTSWPSSIVSGGPPSDVDPPRWPQKEIKRKVSLFLKNSEVRSRPIVDAPARGNPQRDWQDSRIQGLTDDTNTRRLPLRNERSRSWLLRDEQGAERERMVIGAERERMVIGAERERKPPKTRAEWVSFEVNRTGPRRTGQETSTFPERRAGPRRTGQETSTYPERRAKEESQISMRRGRGEAVSRGSMFISRRERDAFGYNGAGANHGLGRDRGLNRGPDDSRLMGIQPSRRRLVREGGRVDVPGLERNSERNPYDYNVVKRYNGLKSVGSNRRKR